MPFNVGVKSEPRGAAKGQFKCEIAADGLTLSQRNKQIKVPVGTRAVYGGKNRVEVTFPDCKLDISVAKAGSYQNRLAKDIATFLSGGGSPPLPADYTLPWYFFAICILPLGIPILTVGGVLPVVIGFALAGACFAIVQKEELSTPIRLLAAGAVVGLGYFATIVLLVLAFAARGR
jgi:hypothetical protein